MSAELMKSQFVCRESSVVCRPSVRVTIISELNAQISFSFVWLPLAIRSDFLRFFEIFFLIFFTNIFRFR